MSRHRRRSGVKCVVCIDQDVTDAMVCRGCIVKLDRKIGDLTGAANDLELTRARQVRMSERNGTSKSAGDTGVAWDDRASRQLQLMQGQLGSIVDDLLPVVVHHGPAHPRCSHVTCQVRRWEIPPVRDVKSIAIWLHWHLELIRHHKAADRIYSQIDAMIRAANWIVDRPADRWYAGPCGAPTDTGEACIAELYARPKDPTITCRGCGAKHDVTERREWLLAAADDQLLHAAWIAQAATALMGDAAGITPSMIYNLARRGRIVAHGVDRASRPLYRFGDVVQVAREIAAKKAERETKRSA